MRRHEIICQFVLIYLLLLLPTWRREVTIRNYNIVPQWPLLGIANDVEFYTAFVVGLFRKAIYGMGWGLDAGLLCGAVVYTYSRTRFTLNYYTPRVFGSVSESSYPHYIDVHSRGLPKKNCVLSLQQPTYLLKTENRRNFFFGSYAISPTKFGDLAPRQAPASRNPPVVSDQSRTLISSLKKNYFIAPPAIGGGAACSDVYTISIGRIKQPASHPLPPCNLRSFLTFCLC